MTIKEYCEKYDQKFQTVYKKIAHHKNSELEGHIIHSKGKSMEIDDFAVDFLLPTQVKVIQAIKECEGIVRENNDLKDKLYSAETIAEQTDKQLSKALVDNKNLLAEIVRFKSSLSEKDKKIYELSEKFEMKRHTSEQTIKELEKRIAGFPMKTRFLPKSWMLYQRFSKKISSISLFSVVERIFSSVENQALSTTEN